MAMISKNAIYETIIISLEKKMVNHALEIVGFYLEHVLIRSLTLNFSSFSARNIQRLMKKLRQNHLQGFSA